MLAMTALRAKIASKCCMSSGCRAARHGDDVDDGIGRAAERLCTRDGVDEGRRRQILSGVNSSHTIFHGAAAGGGAHARMIASGPGIRRGAGQSKPSASVIAIIVAAVPSPCSAERARICRPRLSFHSSSPMRPARSHPNIFQASSGAENIAAPVAAQHRPGRH